MTNTRADRAHLRIQHRLYEAVIDAPEMTDVQRLIVHALIRLTLGWQQRTVTISITELARRVVGHTRGKSSGGFRHALHQLIENGVVRVIEPGDGARTSTFALETDFTRWGRYSTSRDRLAALWDERPPHADHLLGEAREGAPAEAPEGAPGEAPYPKEGDSQGAPGVTSKGHRGSLPRGTPTGSKSDTLRTYDPGKKGKKGKKEEHPPDGGDSGDASKPKTGPPTWLTPFLDAWRTQYGGEMAIERNVRPLKSLVEKLGADEALARWRRYLADTPGRYANAARLAAAPDEWRATPAAAPGANGVHTGPESREDVARRLWRGIQRSGILDARTVPQWRTCVASMRQRHEIDYTDEDFGRFWESLDPEFLRNAYSEKAARDHIAERLDELVGAYTP